MSDDTDAKERKSHVWKRDSLDFYVEPKRATRALLTVEKFNGAILDPSCGQGNIVKVLRGAGYDAKGRDIVDRGIDREAWMGEADFLEQAHPVDRPNIVFNPPFFRALGAEAFIRRALAVTWGKVAAFVDIRFIAGDKRANSLYADFAPHRVWIITPRVSCPPGDYLAAGNKAGNGSADWCWMVWDKTAPYTGTSLGWLRSGKPQSGLQNSL